MPFTPHTVSRIGDPWGTRAARATPWLLSGPPYPLSVATTEASTVEKGHEKTMPRTKGQKQLQMRDRRPAPQPRGGDLKEAVNARQSPGSLGCRRAPPLINELPKRGMSHPSVGRVEEADVIPPHRMDEGAQTLRQGAWVSCCPPEQEGVPCSWMCHLLASKHCVSRQCGQPCDPQPIDEVIGIDAGPRTSIRSQT